MVEQNKILLYLKNFDSERKKPSCFTQSVQKFQRVMLSLDTEH